MLKNYNGHLDTDSHAHAVTLARYHRHVILSTWTLHSTCTLNLHARHANKNNEKFIIKMYHTLL